MKKPDYKNIYTDILHQNPHKMEECRSFLNKKEWSVLDIIELNRRIFGTPDKETFAENQKHRSYSSTDIFRILDYQRQYALNNSQLAIHFSISRNTIAKWKKTFLL